MIPASTIAQKDRTGDQRREAFVAAAREAFFTRGYAGTSMSSISAAVGGSKTTLWTYFRCKEDLFAAVCDDLVERYGCALDMPLDPEDPLDSTLRRFAGALMRTMHSQPVIDLYRLVTGEANRFPELARMFYERAPTRGKARLSDLFATAMRQEQMRAGDPDMAALQFVALCKAGSHQMHILGIIPAPSPQALEAELELAVATFLRAWAPDGQSTAL